MSIGQTLPEVGIDAHVHFFDKNCDAWAGIWPWLTPISSEMLGDAWKAQGQSYVPSNIAEENNWPPARIGYIHIESAHGLDDPVRETQWLESFYSQTGQPVGAIARVSLESPVWRDHAEAQLERELVKGLRDPIASRFLDTPDIHDLLQRLGETNSLFEIYCRYRKFVPLAKLAAAHGETPIVLEHMGLPPVGSPEDMDQYWTALVSLAKHANVYLKVSGIGLITHHDHTIDVAPVIARSIEIFGPQRSLFGSDYPIERVNISYQEILEVMAASLSEFSETERADVMGETARRVYRIGARGVVR